VEYFAAIDVSLEQSDPLALEAAWIKPRDNRSPEVCNPYQGYMTTLNRHHRRITGGRDG
jgi:hypothetical protein